MTFDPGSTSVIWNPVSGRPGRRRRAARLVKRLEALGYTVVHTRHVGHASALAADAVARGGRALVVLGGDGTLREALSATGADVAFAFHPSGTVNLFARSLGIPTDPEAWLALLSGGTTRPVHLARCNGAPFLSVASAGFDAAVCAGVSPRLKRWIQEGAFGVRALADLARFRAARYDVFVDGEEEPWIRGPLAGVLIGKGPYYGGRHRLIPGADHGRPSLEVVALGGSRRRDIVRLAGSLVRGALPAPPATTTRTARHVRIEADPAEAIQVDGEACGTTPALFDLEPRPRRALAPPARRGTQTGG